MNLFRRRRRGQAVPWPTQTDHELDARYAGAIAGWSVVHNRFRDDYTAAQWTRLQIHVRLMDNGLSLRRLLWARWLIETGRVSDGG